MTTLSFCSLYEQGHHTIYTVQPISVIIFLMLRVGMIALHQSIGLLKNVRYPILHITNYELMLHIRLLGVKSLTAAASTFTHYHEKCLRIPRFCSESFTFFFNMIQHPANWGNSNLTWHGGTHLKKHGDIYHMNFCHQHYEALTTFKVMMIHWAV